MYDISQNVYVYVRTRARRVYCHYYYYRARNRPLKGVRETTAAAAAINVDRVTTSTL